MSIMNTCLMLLSDRNSFPSFTYTIVYEKQFTRNPITDSEVSLQWEWFTFYEEPSFDTKFIMSHKSYTVHSICVISSIVNFVLQVTHYCGCRSGCCRRCLRVPNTRSHCGDVRDCNKIRCDWRKLLHTIIVMPLAVPTEDIYTWSIRELMHKYSLGDTSPIRRCRRGDRKEDIRLQWWDNQLRIPMSYPDNIPITNSSQHNVWPLNKTYES